MDKNMRVSLAMDLVKRALLINGLDPRKRSETGNLPTIFAEFSGHVAHITFGIHECGWAPGESGERLVLPLDGDDEDFLAEYVAISFRLEEVRGKAEEILTKAVSADA